MRAYDTHTIPMSLASALDGADRTTVRVRRSTSAGSDTVLSIGSALDVVTGLPQGFLLRSGASTYSQSRVDLVMFVPENGSTQRLTNPQALAVLEDGHSVVIVGSGQIDNTGDDGSTTYFGPAVAVVRGACRSAGPGGPATVEIVVGNGDGFADEVYNDIALVPCPGPVGSGGCCPPPKPPGAAWIVASTATIHEGEPQTSLVRALDPTTLLPDILPITSETFTAMPYPGAISALAPVLSVSLAVIPGIVVVGVLVGGVLAPATNSAVWGLDLATLQPIQPWSLLGYNNPATSLLYKPFGVTQTRLLRVLALPGSEVAIVTNVAAADGTQAVQVLWYNSDTALNLAAGAGGAVQWSNPAFGCTKAMDACLGGNGGAVLVTGNAFSISALAPVHPEYLVPFVPAATGLSTPDVVQPVPFLVQARPFTIRGASNVRPLFTSLPCECACAAPVAHFASSTAVVVAGTGASPLSLVVMGDTDFHPGQPSQSAYLLQLRVDKCVLDYGPATAGAGAGCGPLVVMDALCASAQTTLLVRGPIVVGGTSPTLSCGQAAPPLQLKGMIRYDDTLGVLQLFDGSEWRTLAFQDVPP